jgi:hypothetical protein
VAGNVEAELTVCGSADWVLECITTAPTDPPMSAATKATGSNLFVIIMALGSPYQMFSQLDNAIPQQEICLWGNQSSGDDLLYDEWRFL